ncbi:MAG: hypothetical protein ABJF10_05385 [Chthoniobacter sp.]|uniref:hypothetical protein n=1 Tax=Chthoniobacter sp. TaxID=2510640 RepID=UPI0032AE55C3
MPCQTATCILAVAFLALQAVSGEEVTAEDCMAPDFKHEVYLFTDFGKYHELAMGIRSTGGEKPLFAHGVSSVMGLSANRNRDHFMCLWSPDSRFVAIFERETKRTGVTNLYFASGDKVQEVAFPDLMPRIRPYLQTETRAFWVRPEVWLPQHQLLLSVDVIQNDEDLPAFRFIVTMQLPDPQARHFAGRIVFFQQDKSVK